MRGAPVFGRGGAEEVLCQGEVGLGVGIFGLGPCAAELVEEQLHDVYWLLKVNVVGDVLL